uniref:OFA family MFS transporter n=1 Tax=Escherichia coli TaxID=562 RepID=UPI0011E97379
MDTTVSRHRWLQLGLGLVAMMANSSPQYVWTLFTKPLMATTGPTPAAISGMVNRAHT